METKNALTALIAQSLIVLGMPFFEIAELIGGAANTTTVGDAWDALKAEGVITADMMAKGEEMYTIVEDSQDAMRKHALEKEYAESERIASLPAFPARFAYSPAVYSLPWKNGALRSAKVRAAGPAL